MTCWTKYVDSMEECCGPNGGPPHTHTHTHTHTYADIFAAKCWLSVRDRSDRAEATFLVPSALGHLTDPVPSLQQKRSPICIYWLLQLINDLIYLFAIIHNLHLMFQPIWGAHCSLISVWSLSKYCTCHQRTVGGDDQNLLLEIL